MILAGGAGRRLGGVDKPRLVVGGQTLLDTAIDACGGCAEIVVVGPSGPTTRPVRWTVEDPPGSGPVAALDAGVHALSAAVTTVAVLAADLPAVTPAAIDRLSNALTAADADAVLVTDDEGRHQPLTAVYARAALEHALLAIGDPRGASFRQLLRHLRIATLPDARAAEDIDTLEDQERWTGYINLPGHHD